jgi:hypothetical protein
VLLELAHQRALLRAVGLTEENSVRAYVFRFTLELGHRSMQSACLKRANAQKRTHAPQ